MRHLKALLGLPLLAGSLSCTPGSAQEHAQSVPITDPRGKPVVVYRGERTQVAAPYWQALIRPGQSRRIAVTPPRREAPLRLEDRLPLTSTLLKPAPPVVHTVAGFYSPVFIIGMDSLSMEWLKASADTLVRMGASGLVVQAPERERWLALQEAAAAYGLPLELALGDRLGELFPTRTYPALFISPELADQMAKVGVRP
ncbi:MAG: PFL_4695 family integrating conjugative element protein [Parahaliea sp.]